MKNRIADLFSGKRPRIIPFITAGFPRPELTVDLVLAAERSGAAMVELGMPFSDPLADGPVIQASSQQALDQGVTLKWIIQQVAEIRRRSEIPIVLMGYINPIYRYGWRKFLADCADAGVDGLIIPDLPPEEGKALFETAREQGISPILLVAPNTPDHRIREISLMAGDLIYCVAVLGITGSQQAEKDHLKTYLERVKRSSATPFVVGFGVSSSEDAAFINHHADGAVVGSALIRKLSSADDPVQTLETFMGELAG